MTKTIENFLRYVKIDTQSSEESTTTPSTMKQHDLAGLLVSELEAMGATEITYDKEHCYVYATVPASAGYDSACPIAKSTFLWRLGRRERWHMLFVW